MVARTNLNPSSDEILAGLAKAATAGVDASTSQPAGVKDLGDDGAIVFTTASGSRTVISANGSPTGVAPWVGDTTAPGVPTGVRATSAAGLVTITWDGTLDGGVPADFAWINVLVDGAVVGHLSRAGSLVWDGGKAGATVQVTATSQDDAHGQDGTPAPNVSSPCDAVAVTVVAAADVSAVEQAESAAQDALTAAVGASAIIPGASAPAARSNGLALQAGDQWAHQNAAGQYDSIYTWDGSAWQPTVVFASSMFVIGADGAVEIAPSGITAPMLTADAIDGKTIHGATLIGGDIRMIGDGSNVATTVWSDDFSSVTQTPYSDAVGRTASLVPGEGGMRTDEYNGWSAGAVSQTGSISINTAATGRSGGALSFTFSGLSSSSSIYLDWNEHPEVPERLPTDGVKTVSFWIKSTRTLTLDREESPQAPSDAISVPANTWTQYSITIPDGSTRHYIPFNALASPASGDTTITLDDMTVVQQTNTAASAEINKDASGRAQISLWDAEGNRTVLLNGSTNRIAGELQAGRFHTVSFTDSSGNQWSCVVTDDPSGKVHDQATLEAGSAIYRVVWAAVNGVTSPAQTIVRDGSATGSRAALNLSAGANSATMEVASDSGGTVSYASISGDSAEIGGQKVALRYASPNSDGSYPRLTLGSGGLRANLSNATSYPIPTFTASPPNSIYAGYSAESSRPFVQSGSYIVSTNSDGYGNFPWPTPFLNGVISVVVNSGDSNAHDGAITLGSAGQTTTRCYFHAPGHGAGPVRINYIAIGW